MSIVNDAIDAVVRCLSGLPPSSDVDELRGRAEECLRVLDGWKVSAPTTEERNKLLNRVLRLHVEVAKLEWKKPGS
jgi:hypothetical protein